jgi:hypothetical protein
MAQPADTLDLALRVLRAVTERRYPDPDDIAALQRLAPYAGPMPVDELACELIEQALRHRAKPLAAGAG